MLHHKSGLHRGPNYEMYIIYIYTTVTWNFQKLPSYTFYGGNVGRVLFHSRSFSPWWPLASRRYKISFCSSNRKCLALALFLVELRWPVALLSLFFCLSLSLYSMTINLSLILDKKKTRIQKHFPLFVFVFIDSLAVSASQDAGGHTLSS